MAELAPHPFDSLVRRAFAEVDEQQAIFDLPARAFYTGHPDKDFSVSFHGRRVSSPLGPAAGPQTQMAQNIALSWLGGSRIFELKTVQIKDDLEIPRPCIDMTTIGFNAEWSQELKLHESLDEYVKGAMLVEMLRHHPAITLEDGFDALHYDISVGYDLAGIRHERVDAFLRAMRDTRERVDHFRGQIPNEHSALRELEYPTMLSDTVTLSTFHGCPPDEIERIIRHLMDEHRFHCIVKFNPTLLGPKRVKELLHDAMGYTDIRVPASAFANDTSWDQAVEITGRLRDHAKSLGLGFGAKLSNTLIVENDRGFLPAEEKEVYLSGTPLHVLAMTLVGDFRETFGPELPISFAAGIDRHNYPDAVALGLTPITTCSDLLKPRGYGRLAGYHQELVTRMDAVGANDVDTFIAKAFDSGEPNRNAAILHNTKAYVASLPGLDRYHAVKNSKPPKKIGSHLEFFDCITCDKCIPVCPNDANFWFAWPEETIPSITLHGGPDEWEWREGEAIALEKPRQIGTFADFCNECGNCDVFCPEDGGPYKMKPRFFGSEKAWSDDPKLDGFYLERRNGSDRVLGRFDGSTFSLEVAGDSVRFGGDGFDVAFDSGDPKGTVTASGNGPIDLTPCFIMNFLRHALLDVTRWNYVNAPSR